MNTKTESSRRRKFKRFRIKGSAIVLLHRPRLISIGKPKLVELGPVVDISIGGMAVQYIEHKNRSLEGELLSIRVAGNGIKLESLPFRIVLNRVLASMPDGRKIHKCCFEFHQLSAYQRFQLESFIKSHTMQSSGERRASNDRRHFDDPKFKDPQYGAAFERRSGNERRANWPTV